MELLEEIKTAADDLTADELEKVLQYIQTVKRRRTAEEQQQLRYQAIRAFARDTQWIEIHYWKPQTP